MAMEKLDRRTFLVRAAQVGAAAAVAPAALSLIGCTKKEGGDGSFSCTDTSGLSPDQISMRTQLEYVDLSPKGEVEDCKNCVLYTQPEAGASCGGCTLLAGPIHPEGYCISWAPLPA